MEKGHWLKATDLKEIYSKGALFIADMMRSVSWSPSAALRYEKTVFLEVTKCYALH
jgi:hypothetical protein